MAAFKADTRPDKIDLGIGILRNRDGNTPVMQAVQQAEQVLLRQQQSKAYLGPAGREAFNQQIRSLLLPEIADSNQLATLQTPGGTGALRIAGDLIQQGTPWRANLALTPWLGNSQRHLSRCGPSGGRVSLS